MAEITKQQYENLLYAYETSDQEFIEKLEEYTGIESRLIHSYDFYSGGDYVGNSTTDDIDDILRNAYVEVEDA